MRTRTPPLLWILAGVGVTFVVLPLIALLIRAPWFTRFDIGLAKRIPLQGRTNLEVRFEVLNLFDNINFNNAGNPGAGETIFQVTSHYQDPDNTFDPGGRLGQFMLRINW